GRPHRPGAGVHGDRRRARGHGRPVRDRGSRRGGHRRGRAGGGLVSPAGDAEFVLLGIPDVNGSLRGKALRPAAFESAVSRGTVMPDLLLGLAPVDAPIADYERFGIRSGAADLIVHPDPDTLHPLRWRPGWKVCLATPGWPDGSPCEFSCREV